MKRPARGHGPRGSHLSGEDRALWEHTTQSISPLERAKPRFHAAQDLLHEAARPPADATSHRARMAGQGQQPAPKPHPVHHHEPARHASPPPLADFDRRKAKRIASGRHEIDARIDLHGMRQAEAHAALRRFLLGSHARGLANVLVITGKGARVTDAGDDIYDFFGERERGALKRNVPLWLSEPDLRTVVVSYRTAAIRHGGEGALYVHLRRKRHG